MTHCRADRQDELFDEVVRLCAETLAERSMYVLLHRERDRLLPDETSADLFTVRGRRSVPPPAVAMVMVPQRLEGLGPRAG